jgi:sugar phosphate isomerase/epimerase
MYLGYNTNGFAFHRLDDAVAILHELGFQGIGLTLDVHHLNPFHPNYLNEAERISRLLKDRGLRCVVETGARFLLDARRKHQPTLVSTTPEERAARQEFLRRSIEIAEVLEAEAVSFWTGTPQDEISQPALEERLVDSLAPIVKFAREKAIKLALEPEPGMFIESTQQGLEFIRRLGEKHIGLTVDVGHIHCLQEGQIPTILETVADRLFNVHIEDMRCGVHDHLMFGEGEMEFPPIIDCLERMDYRGGVYVELSRHAHDAVAAAKQSWRFLHELMPRSL